MLFSFRGKLYMEWMAAEVTNLEGLFEIFKVCDTLHLAINNGQYPYVVPLSYGVECVDDHIVLYFHGTSEGMKDELLKNNPHVTCSVDIVYEYNERPGENISCSYASAIGEGEVCRLDRQDYEYAMDLIQTHYGFEGLYYDEAMLESMIFYKIVLNNVSGRTHIKKPEEVML